MSWRMIDAKGPPLEGRPKVPSVSVYAGPERVEIDLDRLGSGEPSL